MTLLEISIAPVGTNTASFSSYVTEATKIIEQRGLEYQTTPTATVIEGDLDQLMDVAKEIHRHALQNGSNRVITNINIDDRTDKPIGIGEQVKSVKRPLP